MIEKMMNWLEGDEQIENHDYDLIKYDLQEMDQLGQLGEDFKNEKMILCFLDDIHKVRMLDFISGMTFVLDYQTIQIADAIYLFLPKRIIYASNA